MRHHIRFFLACACTTTVRPSLAGSIDLHLRRLVNIQKEKESLSTTDKLNVARTGFLTFGDGKDFGSTKRNLREKEMETTVSVLLECKSRETIDKLWTEYGIKARTVLDNGMITADLPVTKLETIAGRPDIGRIEGAHSVKKMNDMSNSFFNITTGGETFLSGMNNSRQVKGSGVIVGVIDSGIDWTHNDFTDPEKGTRILYYWDQSDENNKKPPYLAGDAGQKDYGHEYSKADIDAALAMYNHTWDTATNYYIPVNESEYPIMASARDIDGHGTHVAGTAAGDGSGSGEMGVAPDANIIAVKFDFGGPRSSNSFIVDAVDYILKRAEELGMPAVINLSLGSDYGPHDGTSLEERMYDELTGPGKLVVAAAGNSGRNNWEENLSGGFAIHGSGKINRDPISIRIPHIPENFTACQPEGDYVFFHGWYSGKDKSRIRVTTPGGSVYPRHFRGEFQDEWMEQGDEFQFETGEGDVYISIGGDILASGTDNMDNEIYLEIRNNPWTPLSPGTWKIELIGADLPNLGSYDVWYGASESIKRGWYDEPHPREPTPKFGTSESDNRMTVGTPAGAQSIIAVGAYTTRMKWHFFNPFDDKRSLSEQGYDGKFRTGEIAYFSARGPRRDLVNKPDIAAPGVGIASSLSHFVRQLEWPGRRIVPKRCEISWIKGNAVLPNLEAAVSQGTSMASPNVAGAVALMLEVNPSLSPKDVREVLRKTAMHDSLTEEFEAYHHMSNPDMADTDTDRTPSDENDDWGLGKIDIDLAVSFLLSEGSF